jgi:hypothetical protein
MTKDERDTLLVSSSNKKVYLKYKGMIDILKAGKMSKLEEQSSEE